MSKKRIHYSYEGMIEKSISQDRRLSSLSKPCDAKRRSSGQIFLSYPHTYDRYLHSVFSVPGSAPKPEKKVARMEKVLKDMMYQRKVQAAEREARKLALAKSPRAPGSPGRARIGSPAGSPRTPPSANFTPNRQSPVRMMGQDFTPNRQSPVRMPGSEFTPNRQSPVRLSGQDFTPNRQSPVRMPGQDFTPNRQSPVKMPGQDFTPNRQSPVRMPGQDFTPNRQSPVRMSGQDFSPNRQSPVRMSGPDFTPNRQSPVRMPGPDFRPNRQSPVRMAGSDFKPNRQSPVRMMGSGDGLVTTPLRAPVSADTQVRTSLTEAINTSAPRVESPISKETVLTDPNANETNSGVAKSGTVTPTNPISPRDINTESTKTSESTNVFHKTPSAVAGEDSENPAKAVPSASTVVSENKTQTPVTTGSEPEKTQDNTDTPVPMDTE